MVEDIVKQAILKAANGNEDAVSFLSEIYEVLHLWDDLIDKDKPITQEDIHHGFQTLLFSLPCNPFYVTNFHYLNAILSMSVLNWQASIKIERQPQTINDFIIAFIIRSQYVDLFGACAYLTHDDKQEAISLIVEFRRLVHCEGIENYLTALEKEKNTWII
jgi:hypothetical protein